MSGFTVERRCGSRDGGDFFRRNVGRQACRNRTLKFLLRFYRPGGFAAIKIAGGAGKCFRRFCFLRALSIWSRDSEASFPTSFLVPESLTGGLLNRRQRPGETPGLLRLRSGNNLV